MEFWKKLFKRETQSNYLTKEKVDLQHVQGQPNNDVCRVVFRELKIDDTVAKKLRERYVAFDVETTGLDPHSDRIVELGAIIFENGIDLDRFSSLVNAQKSIHPDAAKKNHITNDMVQNAPSEQSVYSNLVNFLGDALLGKTLICAHHARFDMDFLSEALKRMGFSATIFYVDTCSSAREIIGLGNYRLETIAEAFHISNRNAHRAVYDADVCGKILWELLDKRDEQESLLQQRIEIEKPTNEELEICSYIQNHIKNKGGDISWLRYKRNSAGYVTATCLYTFAKFKITTKGRYIILPNKIQRPLKLPIQKCTVSEGGTNFIRVYFNSPFDLDELGSYIWKQFLISYSSLQQFINQGYYSKKNAEDSIITWYKLSDKEVKEKLLIASNREYGATILTANDDQPITRNDVKVNPINTRCPLELIKNRHNSSKGYEMGFPYWEQGERARKNGDLKHALDCFDQARYNGYDDPTLYSSYAKLYHKLKDYENEIVIIEEFLKRGNHGIHGKLEARRDKAIELLYKKQLREKIAHTKSTISEPQNIIQKSEVINKQHIVGRPVVQMTDTGTILKEYYSIAHAVRESGINSKSIRDAANGKQKHAGGYVWRYKE